MSYSMTDSSPLHWAAALCLPSMCLWLTKKQLQRQSVCIYNIITFNMLSIKAFLTLKNSSRQSSWLGPPLTVALAGLDTIAGPSRCLENPIAHERYRQDRYQNVKYLLDAGADRNTFHRYGLDDVDGFASSITFCLEIRGEPDWT